MQSHFLRIIVLGAALSLSGSCATVCTTGVCNTQAAETYSLRNGLTVESIEGNGFVHDVHWRASRDSRALWVFIEGDGRAWLDDGTIANDPTPEHLLALPLAVLTPGTVMYLGRPCYFKAVKDLRCNPTVWTVDRYSDAVVASMLAVVNEMTRRLHAERIVIVGHSGGGVLAALLAQRTHVAGIVTIAANLDTEAWTQHHGYSPLSGSLNPADAAPLPSSVKQAHLIGDKDEKVPPDINKRYLAQVPAEGVWHYKTFDHTCCWRDQWPGILRRLAAYDEAFKP